MELSTSMQEAILSVGYYEVLSSCTSASVDVYGGDGVFLSDNLLVQSPISEISVSNFTAVCLAQTSEIVRSGVARCMRISFVPYGHITGTVGSYGSDFNISDVNLIKGSTFTITSLHLSFPRCGAAGRFTRRLPVIIERPERIYSPAPDYIDLFW